MGGYFASSAEASVRRTATALIEAGLDLRHIDERGEPLTQAEAAAQSIDAQGSLF